MIFTSSKFLGIAAAASLAVSGTQASFLDKPSVVAYWGQNSRGGDSTQSSLSTYCDDTSDAIVMAFTLNFQDGSLPLLNLANSCTGPNFSGTNLLSCPSIGNDIKTCQSKGKTILMSLGGASGIYGFTSDANAEAFADTLWNIYGGGSSSTRPFGDAVIDGFDLDIEGGGPIGYAAMVTRLRSHFATDKSKNYYITGAPQCPYPDAMLGTVIDNVGFDAVLVQFYNNYCATASGSFNFNTWDTWAKQTSPNKNVKVFLGIPGSSAAAGSGYVPFGQLQPIVQNVFSTYSSFGGISLWDASASYANYDASPNYQSAVAGLVHGLKGGAPVATKATTTIKATTTTKAAATTAPGTKPTTTTKTPATTTTAAPVPTSTPGSCVSNGQSCSVEGQLTCSGDSFGTCNHGSWIIRGCPSGTTCFSTADGASVYCGQGTNTNTCSNAKAAFVTTLRVLKKPKTGLVKTAVGPTAKPFKSSRVVSEFSVAKSDATSFSAIINARRLDKRSFGKTVTVQFKVASNIKITGVKNGQVSQKGNNVKVQYKISEKKTMAAIIELEGKITSGIFVAPNANTMKFA